MFPICGEPGTEPGSHAPPVPTPALSTQRSYWFTDRTLDARGTNLVPIELGRNEKDRTNPRFDSGGNVFFLRSCGTQDLAGSDVSTRRFSLFGSHFRLPRSRIPQPCRGNDGSSWWLAGAASRRVHIAGMTPNPDGVWMAQVARNMSMVFAQEPAKFRPTHIIRDRDSKFTAQFCSILELGGLEFRPIPSVLQVRIHTPKLGWAAQNE